MKKSHHFVSLRVPSWIVNEHSIDVMLAYLAICDQYQPRFDIALV